MKEVFTEKTEFTKAPELVRDILNTSAARHGEKTAFMEKENGEYVCYSFRRYRSDVEALGTDLLCRGLFGKRIMVSGENCYAWAVSYMAVVSGVGTVVPVDPELSAEALAEIIERAEIGAILCSDSVAAKLSALELVDVQIIPFYEIPTMIEYGHMELNRGVDDLFKSDIDTEAPAVIYFTSGATGGNKGVMLSNGNITYALEQASRLVKADSRDIFFSVLPLHHSYENVAGFLSPLWLGATVAFGEGLQHIVKNMNEVHPTVFVCVPTLLETLYRRIKGEIVKRGEEKKVRGAIQITDMIRPLSAARATKRKLFADVHRMLGGKLRLIISGGFPADPKILNRLNGFGFCAIQGYGLTESAALIAINPTNAPVHESVGLCLPDGTVDIYNVQEDGTGEIRYKGQNVMIGYLDDPELTAEVKRGEWLYTGDLGYLDEKGYLYVTGRKKNVIVRAGGKSVFPEELEACLTADRFIREAVVVGFIDEEMKDYDLVAVIHPNYEVFREEFGDNFTRRNVEKEMTRVLAEVNRAQAPHKQMATFVIRDVPFEKSTSRKIKRSGVAASVVEMYRRNMK